MGIKVPTTAKRVAFTFAFAAAIVPAAQASVSSQASGRQCKTPIVWYTGTTVGCKVSPGTVRKRPGCKPRVVWYTGTTVRCKSQR